MDPEPSKRLDLVETVKFMEDKWLRKGVGKVEGKDGQSQLTLGSFQSVHSNLCEKNNLLYTLLQHGNNFLIKIKGQITIVSGLILTFAVLKFTFYTIIIQLSNYIAMKA